MPTLTEALRLAAAMIEGRYMQDVEDDAARTEATQVVATLNKLRGLIIGIDPKELS